VCSCYLEFLFGIPDDLIYTTITFTTRFVISMVYLKMHVHLDIHKQVLTILCTTD